MPVPVLRTSWDDALPTFISEGDNDPFNIYKIFTGTALTDLGWIKEEESTVDPQYVIYSNTPLNDTKSFIRFDRFDPFPTLLTLFGASTSTTYTRNSVEVSVYKSLADAQSKTGYTHVTTYRHSGRGSYGNASKFAPYFFLGDSRSFYLGIGPNSGDSTIDIAYASFQFRLNFFGEVPRIGGMPACSLFIGSEYADTSSSHDPFGMHCSNELDSSRSFYGAPLSNNSGDLNNTSSSVIRGPIRSSTNTGIDLMHAPDGEEHPTKSILSPFYVLEDGVSHKMRGMLPGLYGHHFRPNVPFEHWETGFPFEGVNGSTTGIKFTTVGSAYTSTPTTHTFLYIDTATDWDAFHDF